MNSISKPWDWDKNSFDLWLKPSEESHYILNRWKEKGYRDFLDLGCGLGRHSIFFAKNGFYVTSCDLSIKALDNVKQWAIKEKLNIKTVKADMISLPFNDNSFDCLLAYHVISHTDSNGINKILSEIGRVLRPGGEFYITLCSKNSGSFKDAGYPKLDENTVIKIEDGPENNIPHFYVNEQLLKELLVGLKIINIRQIQEIISNGKEYKSWHYFILGSK